MTADLPFTADPTIAGVDEAGRGPLAGPVVAAAVILSPDHPIEGLRDSKKLSARRREALADEIREKALAFAVASASVEEIDRLNILQATLLAMQRAALPGWKVCVSRPSLAVMTRTRPLLRPPFWPRPSVTT